MHWCVTQKVFVQKTCQFRNWFDAMHRKVLKLVPITHTFTKKIHYFRMKEMYPLWLWSLLSFMIFLVGTCEYGRSSTLTFYDLLLWIVILQALLKILCTLKLKFKDIVWKMKWEVLHGMQSRYNFGVWPIGIFSHISLNPAHYFLLEFDNCFENSAINCYFLLRLPNWHRWTT